MREYQFRICFVFKANNFVLLILFASLFANFTAQNFSFKEFIFNSHMVYD